MPTGIYKKLEGQKMKPNSIRSKGKRFEKYICEQIELAGFGQARREVGSGSGKKKGDIFANLPFLLECKNHKRLNWFKSIDQSKSQAEKGNWDKDKWALIVRDSRTPEDNPHIYTLIDFWQFLELLKRNKEPQIKKPNKEMKWDLTNLKNLCNKIIKKLE